MRTVILTLAVLLLLGTSCALFESNKTVNIHEGAISFTPALIEAGDAEDATDSKTEYLLPDGSYLSLVGGGMVGNFLFSIMMNDGTTQDAKADIKADATVTPGGP